ncbi:ATP-dependent helicase/nuclease subunit B [Aequitasia blattaphilus]|uniref:PD-(D/E)XK nuclease family protein n=1 Tax=Aequitasia blattaphilus TaxID=2949332 RepID=A0ABT1E9V8_9FIRM|nr:PD-(D/E)XK nuclease family protein [Aequitasia blattaphilus]MCP1102620.1 PD-(D/E)XK nuclease family protein [Aequitasia blattaphilus]MCR8615260.1 PD-(D/E)XK nuclease family protein [Aequitasia blattaphilus]
MALQFVMGPSGSGKSYYLQSYTIEESIKYPKENFIILVPEQFTLTTQREIVTRHPKKGIMNIDVLSFARLAYRVFEEQAYNELILLDDEGKNLILQKIAKHCEKDLTILKGNMQKPGYIQEVKSVLSEFMQYDIGEEQLDEMLEEVGEKSRLYYKLKDIASLYKEFKGFIDNRYLAKEELLDKLCPLVKESNILKNATLVLDSFTGFTPVQMRLLTELLCHCKNVVITVTIRKNVDPYTNPHPYHMFALSKQMVTSLVQIARERKVEIKEPVRLFEDLPYRFAQSGSLELAFLNKNIFGKSYEGFQNEVKNIRILRTKSPKEEAIMAAKEIRRLIRNEEMRYRDIGIIVGDIEVYQDGLRNAFQDYEIPLFIDEKKSVLYNPVIDYIRSFLMLFTEKFSYDSVFRYLKSSVSGYDFLLVAELENICLARGTKGQKKWEELQLEKEELTELKNNFLKKVLKYAPRFRNAQKTVEDIAGILYEFLVEEEIEAKLREKEAYFEEKKEFERSKEYGQVYRILLELLDKMVALLGEEKIALKDFVELLDAGLLEAKVGAVFPGMDQVIVGDLTRTRLDHIKVLFFIGANDIYIPGNLNTHGLLTESDREKFREKKYALSPGGKEKAYTQKFYLYSNLTKPSERLFISYSTMGIDGSAQRPSYLIGEVKRLFGDIEERIDDEVPLWKDENTTGSGFSKVIHSLWKRNEYVSDETKELIKWYRERKEYEERLLNIFQARFGSRKIQNLSEEIAKAMYHEDFRESISRMENYANCAYSHFLNYGLHLKEREEFTFNAMDLGNVCHGALEKYSKSLKEKRIRWGDLEEEEKEALVNESVEREVEEFKNDIFDDTKGNAFLITRIKELLKKTVWALTKQLEAGDFIPTYFEEKFEHGIIDRIDFSETEDKVYVKVLDYKTGHKEFDITEVYYGLQLQLLFYLKAALSKAERDYPGKEAIPAGAMYYQIKNPLIEKTKDETALMRLLLKALKPDGVINIEEECLPHFLTQKEGGEEILPIQFNKDGSLSKRSYQKGVEKEDLKVMMDYSETLIAKEKGEILEGRIAPEPIKLGKKTGCDFCPYGFICGFDGSKKEYEYREATPVDMEEGLRRMKGGEENGNEVDA